ncbi:nitrogen fixation protein NifQ [Massilia sp. YIM B04103]|uniref:nitrogen fixation protein NifQ n=1 Tax=Massilia sp. YIM B04103 TaxID=2963106 RepID=UPI00210B4108|nr:nitrogen fixation protein NifQ [Massilia sp. YIM B04103]
MSASSSHGEGMPAGVAGGSFATPALHDPAALMAAAVAGVLRHAAQGELPPFARTLGLPLAELAAMVAYCLPPPAEDDPHPWPGAVPQSKYRAIADSTPAVFKDLSALLLANRSAAVDERHAAWAARAVAAASLGGRHLWQDLGLNGRQEVSALLSHYFGPLFQRNTRDLKWKRFLYLELGAAQGIPELRPPKCLNCDQYRACFPL